MAGSASEQDSSYLAGFLQKKKFSAMNNIDPLSTLMTGWICIGLILI